MKELVSFLSVQKEITEEEKQGRASGGVEWRRARGELGQPKEVWCSLRTLKTSKFSGTNHGICNDCDTWQVVKTICRVLCSRHGGGGSGVYAGGLILKED